MAELHSSNFRVIITNILGVRIFRKSMVDIYKNDFPFPVTPFLIAVMYKQVKMLLKNANEPPLPTFKYSCHFKGNLYRGKKNP